LKKNSEKRLSVEKRRRLLFSGRSAQNNGRPFLSLRIKFAMVLIISSVGIVVAMLMLIPLSASLITKEYMQPERLNLRLDDYIKNFSDYVAEENITSDDAASVARWSMYHRNVHLVVFGGEKAQFGVADGEILEGDDAPEISDPVFTENIPIGETSDTALGNTYFVRFADRVCSVSVMDYSGQAVYNGIQWGGAILALLAFFIIVLVYYHFQTKAILRLSAEVEEVSGGALSAPIHSKRTDEIGGLARDVDNMRTTILKKMEEEKAAREANGELITSMSHDIRTPLTTLLGYMELLQNDCEGMTDEQKTYVRLCSEKAAQIKELSDKLFLYFWAYSIGEDHVDTESCDIRLLGEQMIGEWLLPMENEGLTLKVQSDTLPAGTCVAVNTECLRRIIDNLLDNIRKYAHRDHPVEILVTLSPGKRYVCLTFRNTIGSWDSKTTGTHIGHKTCTNMANLMGGRFETVTKGDVFEARLYMPVDSSAGDHQ